MPFVGALVQWTKVENCLVEHFSPHSMSRQSRAGFEMASVVVDELAMVVVVVVVLVVDVLVALVLLVRQRAVRVAAAGLLSRSQQRATSQATRKSSFTNRLKLQFDILN
jgi:hypothetical protein